MLGFLRGPTTDVAIPAADADATAATIAALLARAGAAVANADDATDSSYATTVANAGPPHRASGLGEN